MKLSIAMILGKCDDKVLATFDSISQIADEIILVQTNSDQATAELVKSYDFTCDVIHELRPDLLHEDGFLRSFADARNESFKLATGDMVMWIDADDVISNPETMRQGIERAFHNGVDMIRVDYDYEFSPEGLCTTRHSRERIVKNGYFKWIAPIHEVLSPIKRANFDDMDRSLGYIIHNNIQGDDNAQRKERNYRMLKRIVEEGGDQRMKMYYGNALVDMEKFSDAIKYYMEYLEESTWDDERYLVMIRIQNVYKRVGDLEAAAVWCLRAVELAPTYKDAFLALAEIDSLNGKWDRVIHWIRLHGQCVDLDRAMIHNPAGAEVQPLLLLQKAYHECGDFERVLACTDQLRALLPNKVAQWDAVEAFCRKQLYDMDMIKTYEKILATTPEEDHVKIYDIIPKEIADYPAFKRNLKKDRPQSKKVVAIYCGHDDTQAWGPESIKTGIGGSEEAVINISREFAKLGWTVEVYCNCISEGNIDGVNWYRADAANNRDLVDLTILWRHPSLVYEAPKGLVTWLWNHDLQNGMEPFYDEKTMGRIDKVMFLSDFHATTAPWVPDEKIMFTRNGVDPDLMIKGDNDPYTVIYASSPDRGLDTLLSYWPEVIKAHPKAKLKVFYGFNKWFDLRYKNDRKMMEWKENLLDIMEKTPSITYYGSVGQDVLASHIASAGVWAYPTQFGEISCITAMKMQCGGAIPVTSNYAALNETCEYGIQVGEYLDPICPKDEYVKELINMVGNKREQETIRTQMIPWCQTHFTWSKVAKEWNAAFLKDCNKKLAIV